VKVEAGLQQMLYYSAMKILFSVICPH